MNSPQIIRTDDLRVENRHRILSALRLQGSMSRVEVARQTGLSQASLSTLLGLMTIQGIVKSANTSSPTNKRGRPQTTVSLSPDAGMAISVALTIHHISFNIIDYAGNNIHQIDNQLDTQALTASDLKKAISSGINKALKQIPNLSLKAISVGFQGVTDADSGELLWSPITSIDQFPIRSYLTKKYGVPVSVNNDCGLIARALFHKEYDKLGDSFAAVLFSHGIGLGVYLSGTPFSGATSSALELGHVQYEKDGALCRCGKTGCIEAYAANYGILRSAKGQSLDEAPAKIVTDEQMQALIDAAANQDEHAIRAFETAGKAIGAGLTTIFTLLDPIPVALVGHNTDAVDLMRKEIRTALKSVGREPKDYSALLHCYHDDVQLLKQGLIHEAMSIIDRDFAENTDGVEGEATA